MYCGKCGTENDDNSSFCRECGAPLTRPAYPQNATSAMRPISVKENQRNRKIGIIAVGIVAVIAVIICVNLAGSMNYKAPIKRLMNAIEEMDAKELLSVIPDGMVDHLLEEEGYDRSQLDQLLDEYEEQLESSLGFLSYLGDGLDFSYKFLGDASLSASELKDLQDEYEEYDVKINSAKNVSVELTVKLGALENTQTMKITVIRVGSKWYIDVTSLSDSI